MKFKIVNAQKAVLYLLLLTPISSFSQDTVYAHAIINTLTSPRFEGRGYVKSGDKKAAAFIAKEFSSMGILPGNKDYYQRFRFDVNTFPSRMNLCIGGKKLVPGTDYIIHPASAGSKSTFPLLFTDSARTIETLQSMKNECVLAENRMFSENEKEILAQKTTGAVILLEDKKLTWSVSLKRFNIPVAIVLKDKLPANATDVSFSVKSGIVHHEAKNVTGYIKGVSKPDSFIVFSAHYDHLGRMGRHTFFPGANDNASGIAMLLNLARHYSRPENKPACSMLFIAFAGEEAGLLGSKYFTEHPLIKLEQIKCLINLDLLGTGDEGLMVVNATEYPVQFALMKKINAEYGYINPLSERGPARNSDHWYFSQKGVPSFFLYTLGGIKAYHDVFDKAETLPLTRFSEVFRLIRHFSDSL